MPIIVPSNLPAARALRQEGLYILEQIPPGVQPLRILLLNLMPHKAETETDFIRMLAPVHHYIQLLPMKISGQTYKHTSDSYMQAYYQDFETLSYTDYDGLIVTGAPIEHLPFEQVRYWTQLTQIFAWAKTHVRSTLYICWGAQAALYYHYGVNKVALSQKMFGIYEQSVLSPPPAWLQSLAPTFYMPQSRHTSIDTQALHQLVDLSIVAQSPLSGPSVLMTPDGGNIFVTGHMEYPAQTLDQEYHRDLAKGLPINCPYHYYRQDDPSAEIEDVWCTQAAVFYAAWIDYFVAPSATAIKV